MERIVIKHLNGARANQEESFPLNQFLSLTIGRDPTLNLKFDPADDVVSRNHARIERDAADPGKFRIIDNQSTNGVFVNGAKIAGTADIHHGDVVRLGADGPEFLFSIDPPPANALKATRVVEAAGTGKPTRESTIPATVIESPAPAKPAVGRETVERMLTASESNAKKQVVNWVAAVIGVVVLVAGGLFWYQKRIAEEQKRQADQAAITLAADKKQREEEAGKKFDATRIAAEYGGSTVYIEASWKLIDVDSKKAVYHQYRMVTDTDEEPRYVQLADRTIEPLLTLNDRAGEIVGGRHTGTGFVVREDGFILTNRHVAEAWNTNGYWRLRLPGSLYRMQGGKLLRTRFENTRENRDALEAWVPARSKQTGQPLDPKTLIGENQFLHVTFAKTKARIPGRIAKVSDEADTALIKIDMPKSLTSVKLAESSETLKQGEPVVVLGYPGLSPNAFVIIESQDPLVNTRTRVDVPDNTVSVGAIGRLNRGGTMVAGDTKLDYVSLVKDMFQLTINSTGPGNSGGPVFNEKGRVIGILTLKGDSVTFATPIKYGLDLLDIKPVIK